MVEVILGSEALKQKRVTRGQLRVRWFPVFPDTYIPRGTPPTLSIRTTGAWLWSGRRGVITGRAAAALHGARWVADDAPIELLWKNSRPPSGIIARDERFNYDDVQELAGMAVATVERTAFDVARHLPLAIAVANLDALASATRLTAEMVAPLVDRHTGARNIKRVREALELIDAGSQSPKETWLRLLIIRSHLFEKPQTQIPVRDRDGYVFAYLDMGWRDRKIALEYDGDHHRTDRKQYVRDQWRIRELERLGWIVIRVIAEDRPSAIVERIREAFARRETEARAA